jgi:TPR repeat protein
MKYFKQSADNGYAKGMFKYGIGNEKGYLGKKDIDEAMKYYKMSADKGYDKGLIYFKNALKKSQE